MAHLPDLVKMSELKTNLIRNPMAHQCADVNLHFDEAFDALIVRYVPKDQRAIVHYVDDNVAFLVLPETLEIVGFQIEDFKSRIPWSEGITKTHVACSISTSR